MTEEKVSVLSNLIAAVGTTMDEKKAAARTLTPVAGEVKPPVLPKTPESFPNDMPQEVVEQKVEELTRIIDHLTQARDALAGVAGVPVPGAIVDLDAIRKAKEAAADAATPESFAERQERLAAEAKAAVFKGPAEDDGLAELAEPEPDLGWVCPTHGKAVEKTSQKTGKTFIGCPDCNAFKR